MIDEFLAAVAVKFANFGTSASLSQWDARFLFSLNFSIDTLLSRLGGSPFNFLDPFWKVRGRGRMGYTK